MKERKKNKTFLSFLNTKEYDILCAKFVPSKCWIIILLDSMQLFLLNFINIAIALRF